MELTYWQKQVILYTKGHFKRVDYDTDLKYFAARMYSLHTYQVDKQTVLNMVTSVFDSLWRGGYVKFTPHSFIDGSFTMARRNRDSIDICMDDLLQYMLSSIHNILVAPNNIDLGFPDKEVLDELESI